MNHLLPALAWTLIHFCWQAAAIAALYGIVSYSSTHRSSEARYLQTLSALVAMLITALATFLWQWHVDVIATNAAPQSSHAMSELSRSVQQTIEPMLMRGGPSASSTWSVSPLLPWIDSGWLLGVFAFALRSMGGWWIIRRLRKSAVTSVPAAAAASFNRLVEAFGIRRSVILAVSNSVSGPLTIGYFRALVLLPLSAITALGPDELEVVLAHELAHVRRADFVWNLVQTFAETVFFFHPAVWWIGNCLRNERELCCDDLALRLCPNPVVYASALFHLEEQRSSQSNFALALQGNGPTSNLRSRIMRILGEPNTKRVNGPSRIFSISVALAAIALVILPSSQLLAKFHPVQAATVISKSHWADLSAGPSVHPMLSSVVPSVRNHAVLQNAAQPSQPSANTSTREASKSNYIDRMKAAGYDVDLDKYIALKSLDVTPEYASAMSQVGFGKLSADDLISSKVQGITPEYIAELKRQGLEVSSIHDAISFHIFQVTPEFISGMKAAGFPGLSTKQLTNLRVQGITPEYARSVVQQFPGASVDDVIKVKLFNIDSNFIESAKQHGFTNLKLEKLVQLRLSGLLDDEK